MHVLARRPAERVRGVGFCGLFAVGALAGLVVGLAGDLGAGVGREGVGGGGGAGGKGLGVEFGGGVVADLDAGFVLRERVSVGV